MPAEFHIYRFKIENKPYLELKNYCKCLITHLFPGINSSWFLFELLLGHLISYPFDTEITCVMGWGKWQKSDQNSNLQVNQQRISIPLYQIIN